MVWNIFLWVWLARVRATDSGEERTQEAQDGSFQIPHICHEEESQISSMTFNTCLKTLSKLTKSEFYHFCKKSLRKINLETNCITMQNTSIQIDLIESIKWNWIHALVGWVQNIQSACWLSLQLSKDTQESTLQSFWDPMTCSVKSPDLDF